MAFAKIKNVNAIYPIEDDKFEKVMDYLPAGIYEPERITGLFSGIIKYKILTITEDLIAFDQGVVREIINKVDDFFKPQTIEAYQELKIGHKMGMLLHGPHGTGKTCAAFLAMQLLIKNRDAICLNVTGLKPWDIGPIAMEIRKKHTNPIVLFLDEADYSFKLYEETWLTVLDGHESTMGVVFIGCTNKLDKIADRIKDRKSRIKHLFEVDKLPIAVYETYIREKLSKSDKLTITKFAYIASDKDLTIDELKHAVIDYRLESISIEEAVEIARKASKRPVVNQEGDLEDE